MNFFIVAGVFLLVAVINFTGYGTTGKKKVETVRKETKQEKVISLKNGAEKIESGNRPQKMSKSLAAKIIEVLKIEKTPEEALTEALKRSADVKGVYMTGAVANYKSVGAVRLREKIINLIDETALNAVVIDVKETKGSEMTPNLKPLLERLKEKNIWAIARVVVFNDNSLVSERPDLYLKRADGSIWRDARSNAWLDPTNSAGWEYILKFTQSVVDIGFDEIQFDYIRFPTDGDTYNIAYSDLSAPKHVFLRSFFEYLHTNLKKYKPDIILSADLFGYVATQRNDDSTGQRIQDIGNNFDYVSFMVYPSHYYDGFYAPADPERSLPEIYLPYEAGDAKETASANPFQVVYRSMIAAGDAFPGAPTSTARLRPWLQDFNLGSDMARGIYYDAQMIKSEIEAAEKAGTSGWLLWNAANVYTEEALRNF